ncbi:hypothetical protein ABCY62_09820 [Acetivibrio clariflavus]
MIICLQAHTIILAKMSFPGETVTGTITFITPEAYPHCLWEGKVINIQEGNKIIGYAKVTKVMNELLKIEE